MMLLVESRENVHSNVCVCHLLSRQKTKKKIQKIHPSGVEIIESQSALGWKRLIELQPPYHGQSCHPPGPAAQGKARCDLSALPLKLFHSNQT